MQMKMLLSLVRAAVLATLIFGIQIAVYGQRDSIYRLPVGTRITLKLDAELSSRVATVDDTFVATIAKPVLMSDVVVLPTGTAIEGRVTGSRAASAGGKQGKLELSFDTIRFSADLIRKIEGELVGRIDPVRNDSFKTLSILGGAGIGAAIGVIGRTGRTIALGTGIGAGIGTGIALSRRGSDVSIGKNVEFEIELKKEVILPVLDY